MNHNKKNLKTKSFSLKKTALANAVVMTFLVAGGLNSNEAMAACSGTDFIVGVGETCNVITLPADGVWKAGSQGASAGTVNSLIITGGTIYDIWSGGPNGPGVIGSVLIDSSALMTNLPSGGRGFTSENASTIGSFTNNGTIYSDANGFSAFAMTKAVSNWPIDAIKLTTFINNGTIEKDIDTVDWYTAIETEGNIISSFTNSATGRIIGGNNAIQAGGVITELNNAGLIQGRNGAGIYNYGSIGTLTNTGTITGGGTPAWGEPVAAGIHNHPEYAYSFITSPGITTLNNGQGTTNAAGPLTYYGALPTNYNVIINSASNYGQLSVLNAVYTGTQGTTTFGVSPLSAKITALLYPAVISSTGATITSSSFTSRTGTFNGVTWNLVEESTPGIWDLVFSALPVYGPSTVDTQQSLVNTASVLQNIYTLQNSVLANSFTYDCSVFDKNNICVSSGGRNTAVSAANGLNNTSGLLIAAYRPHANYRVGAYIDQNLSVNNAGSTVNLGNNTPLVGLFGVWNERLDDTGTEVKVSAAYGQKNTAITRAVVGTSEAGSGSSQLNSQGAQVVAKYGFGVTENVIVAPYAGIRYTQNNMGGYTENASASVVAPLTYSALNTNATTALAGVGASYRGIPQTNLFASAGVETDTNTSNGSYSATGVAGLTSVNFNTNPVKTRPTAMVGATYDIAKNQRLGLTGIYRQEAYQAVQTTTVMATYTVGL